MSHSSAVPMQGVVTKVIETEKEYLLIKNAASETKATQISSYDEKQSEERNTQGNEIY